MSKIDQRILNTKQKLSDAITQYLKTSPLEALSVSDIVSLAKINRSTFYLHYKSLDECLDEFEQDLYSHLELKLNEFFNNTSWMNYLIDPHNKTSLPILEFILQEISENRSLQAFIKSRQYNSEFLIQMVDGGFKNAMNTIKQSYPDVNLNRYEYYFSFVSMGIMGFVVNWVTNGLIEPIEHISELLHQLLYQTMIVLDETKAP